MSKNVFLQKCSSFSEKVAGGAFTFPLETSIIQKVVWKDLVEVTRNNFLEIDFVFKYKYIKQIC